MTKLLNHTFVAATMSAGKSSLINALIGQELLHSANEATTAKVTRIYHLKDAQSASASYCAKGLVVDACMRVCPEQLKVWNQAEHVARIDITVPLSVRQQKKMQNDYAIFDSPGANNSQDQQHRFVFIDALKQQQTSTILYVLNATQLGTRDDAEILTTIRQSLPKAKIVFALNKADQLDEELGEAVGHYVNNACNYLKSLGFEHPVIVPTMARVALIAKKHLNNEVLGRRERMELSMELERFRENPHRLNDASFIPLPLKSDMRRLLDQRPKTEVTSDDPELTITDHYVEQLIAYSGISTIQHLITQATPKKGGQLTTQNVTNVNCIYIEHNPFTVETLFQINGETPPESLEIQGYRHKRLQLWVEKIFDNLSEIFNGANSFFVKFKGVESDFIDLQEAAEKAKQLGMSIELEWQAVKPAEERLVEIKALLETLQKDPKFAHYIENSGGEEKRNFEAAFDNNFDAYVVATMSSGKSTFINAMLGQDLLPAANEATTATIAHIIDNKTTGDRFTGKRLGENRMLLAESDAVHPKLLKEWNSNSETKAIELTGNIRAVEPNDNVRLVLTDTPGPNNSQDEEHERTTMGFIQDSKRNPLILYILNGTQLATNDDRRLLKLVADEMTRGGKQSKDRFLFVINKMDDFDPEKGEDIGAVLGSVRKYLQDNGIDEPNIFPISARFAYLLREQGELTRSERNDKRSFEDLFLEEASMDLPMYTTMPSKVRNDMETKTSSVAMLRSGLPAVEATIDEYIKKYAFPLRLHRAHEALSEAIKEGIREAELTQKMELDQQQLDQLHRDIKELKKRRDSGFNTKAYQEKVKQEGHALPEGVQHELDEIEAAVYTLIRTLGEDFDGEASVDSAHQQLDTAARDVEFAFKKTINNYEQAFDRSQELIKDRLREEYQQHVASLFPDSKALELPAFKMLKESISAISLVFDLQEDEVQSREEVSGYRTVSVSKWYNPFSWWETEQVAEYKTVEFVKLKNIWKERLTYIRTSFDNLKKKALARINADKDKLVDNYLSFMEREFMAKFDALLDDLETKIKHSDQLEAAIEEAKKEQLRIKKIKQDVANILQF